MLPVQLRSMSDALSPTLRSMRQQEYYPDPKFHASIAWALLHQTGPRPLISSAEFSKAAGLSSSTLVAQLSDSDGNIAACSSDFPTIPGFPEEMITTLNAKYGAKLSSPAVSSFVIDSTTLKIGKETFSWKFSDS